MAGYDYDFEEHRAGITRYVVWALVICLAVGGFLYADGYFETIAERTTQGPGERVDAG